MRFVVFVLCAFAATASADESGWHTTWDGTLYGYANSTVLREDSVLNPGNQIARLAQRSDVAELRLNFKAENEAVRITARPIASTRELRSSSGAGQRSESYVSQWQVRVKATEAWSVSAGRDVLNWGAAQFRSPSSPFYFDNGRNDPMRELVGMDAAKLTWTPDIQRSASLVRIVRSGYGAAQPDAWPDPWKDSWLAKFDLRGDGWAYGVVSAKAPDVPAFYGAYGQASMSDALMLYGEIGSSANTFALQSSADASQPFTVQIPSSRRTTSLAGAAYTFESGHAFTAEYLHDGHGYTSGQESAYFQRAGNSPGMALGLAPRLLGRDYLHLVWQSNMMNELGYWRLMYTRNLTGGGNEFGGYGETVLAKQVSAYLLAVWPQGNARQESAALLQRSVTFGLKIALP